MALCLHWVSLLVGWLQCLHACACVDVSTMMQADDAAMADKKEEVKVLKGGGAAAAGAGFLRYVLCYTLILKQLLVRFLNIRQCCNMV
jgi:hypothetical protein